VHVLKSHQDLKENKERVHSCSLVNSISVALRAAEVSLLCSLWLTPKQSRVQLKSMPVVLTMSVIVDFK
jgi:hypothetical protein